MNKKVLIKFVFIIIIIILLYLKKSKHLIKKNIFYSYFNKSLEQPKSLDNSNLGENKTIKYNQYIPIAYALNEGYFYPTFVSIISILVNSNISCCYVIYLLLAADGSFPELLINKFKELENQYHNCKIIFIDIEEEIYAKAFTKRYPKAAYYRLLIADIVTDYDRVIYLDGDTIIFNDLIEMINLDMKNNIALGWVDNGFINAKQFNVTINHYITSGVILFNVKKMREENITDKLFNFMNKYYEQLNQEDQTILNIVLYDRIDFLPAKYGIWTYNNIDDLIYHNHFKNTSSPIKGYDDKEIIKALYEPGIAHYVRSKPWKPITKHTCLRFRKIWWDYAQLSGEYKYIKEYYNLDK